MDKILVFLTPKLSFWVILALVSVIAGVRIQLSESRKNVETLQANLASCTANLATSQANEATLGAGLKSANTALEAMQKQNAKKAAMAAAAFKEALKQAEKRKADASRMGAGADVMNAWQKGVFQ